MNYSRALTLLTAALFLLGTAPAPDMSPYTHPHQLVDIGGRKLNLNCTGSGRTTVVLESGTPDSSGEWFAVQPRIARFARVCSYDRAGLGFSDPGPMPRDAAAIVSDLHALLHAAHVPGPYVLVGHSGGGLYAPVYAGRYPSEVSGMVLVDPAMPYESEVFARAVPSLAKEFTAGVDKQTLQCQRAAHDGTLNQPPFTKTCDMNAWAANRCKTDSPNLCTYWHYYVGWFRYARVWDEEVSEEEALGGRSSDEAMRVSQNYGSMPLIVLTSGEKFFLRSLPRAQSHALWEAWKGAHDRIAARSSVGANYVVGDSSHNIEADRPDAVVSAVFEVVQQVESRTPVTK